MPDNPWIENRGRAPRDPEEKRYLRLRCGWETTEAVRVGNWRWDLNRPRFANAGDIIASKKP